MHVGLEKRRKDLLLAQVLGQYRGRGVGKLLIEAGMKAAADMKGFRAGVERLVLLGIAGFLVWLVWLVLLVLLALLVLSFISFVAPFITI